MRTDRKNRGRVIHHWNRYGHTERCYYRASGDGLASVLTIVFCLGALIFYSLFYRTKLVPRWLSGLFTIIPYLAAALLALFALNRKATKMNSLPFSPKVLLHLEGFTLLLASVGAYAWSGGSWLLFGVFLLAPDLAMLGYLTGPKIGATLYNVFHSYPLPAALLAWSLVVASPLWTSAALIWLAHIGMDRTLGYGLKYDATFRDTHLGRV